MQKIMTKAELEKKSKRNQFIVGFILILLMLLSSAGYAITNKEDKSSQTNINYKDIDFIRDSDYWYFKFDGKDFMTKYNPLDTKNITVNTNTNTYTFTKRPLYFAGNYQAASYELKRNLNSYALRLQDACIKSEGCPANYPIKNCSQDNVIIIEEPEKGIEGIRQNEKCIHITASIENQTFYSDAFLFKTLGI